MDSEAAGNFNDRTPCWDDIGTPPLDAPGTRRLLARQVQLLGQQLRGNMSEVRRWIAAGDLCECVAESARAVGLFVAEEVLVKPGTPVSGDAFSPFVNRYGDVLQLQPDDYLFHESRWARVAGTCFLVAPDIIMTAAHVIGPTARRLMERGEMHVVFDFQGRHDQAPPSVMSRQRSVFSVVDVIKAGANTAPGTDWISLRLDRPAANRPLLRVAAHELDFSREVYCLGHPKAIALRYARSRLAWSSRETDCFEAHLDGYDGVSGAPVFDGQSHMVVGMMIRSCPTPDGRVLTYQNQYLSPLCHGDDRRCGAVIVSSRKFADGF